MVFDNDLQVEQKIDVVAVVTEVKCQQCFNKGVLWDSQVLVVHNKLKVPITHSLSGWKGRLQGPAKGPSLTQSVRTQVVTLGVIAALALIGGALNTRERSLNLA